MSVETVVRRVRLAADEPFGERRVRLEFLIERPKPMHLLPGQIPPELFWIGLGSVVQLLISLHRADLCLGRERGRRGEYPLLVHHRINLSAAHAMTPVGWAMPTIGRDGGR